MRGIGKGLAMCMTFNEIQSATIEYLQLAMIREVINDYVACATNQYYYVYFSREGWAIGTHLNGQRWYYNTAKEAKDEAIKRNRAELRKLTRWIYSDSFNLWVEENIDAKTFIEKLEELAYNKVGHNKAYNCPPLLRDV